LFQSGIETFPLNAAHSRADLRQINGGATQLPLLLAARRKAAPPPFKRYHGMAKQSATPRGVLNARQLRFIDEYLVDLNATQAAIRAGYSKRSAAEQGYDLLRHPHISLALEAKRKELAVQTGITRERILGEMAAIAFADVRKLFNADGSMRAIGELDDDTARALSSVEVSSFTPPGEGSQPEWTKKVRFWDKPKALEALLKHLGMEGDKPDGPAGGAIPSALGALLEKLEKAAQ